jgi:hypothetical protein
VTFGVNAPPAAGASVAAVSVRRAGTATLARAAAG